MVGRKPPVAWGGDGGIVRGGTVIVAAGMVVVPEGSVTVTAGIVVTEPGRVMVVVGEGANMVTVVVLVVPQLATANADTMRRTVSNDIERVFTWFSSFLNHDRKR